MHKHVLDDRVLLNGIPGPQGLATYHAIVVFDGYDDMSMMTHLGKAEQL